MRSLAWKSIDAAETAFLRAASADGRTNEDVIDEATGARRDPGGFWDPVAALTDRPVTTFGEAFRALASVSGDKRVSVRDARKNGVVKLNAAGRPIQHRATRTVHNWDDFEIRTLWECGWGMEALRLPGEVTECMADREYRQYLQLVPDDGPDEEYRQYWELLMAPDEPALTWEEELAIDVAVEIAVRQYRQETEVTDDMIVMECAA